MLTRLVLFISLLVSAQVSAKNLYDFSLKDSSGKEQKLSQFKDKVVLVVNIATKCGYTPQLDDLEALYKKYQSKGFILVGIPSNDFGGQTPESSEGAAKFCRLTYGVSFPIMEKVVVKGEEKTEFFKWIKESRKDKNEISWNFEKFLFNKEGKLVEHYKSKVLPQDEKLISKIEELL